MGQVHLKLLIRSVQTPPFLHGLELHSSISMWQFLPLKPIDQREKKNEFIIKIIASAIFPTSISTTAVHPVDNMMDAKNMLLGAGKTVWQLLYSPSSSKLACTRIVGNLCHRHAVRDDGIGGFSYRLYWNFLPCCSFF